MRESIQAVYRPQKDGVLLLFGGDFDVDRDGEKHTVAGQLELCLLPSPKLTAHFAGPAADLRRVGFTIGAVDPAVAVSRGADLAPPTSSTLCEHLDGNWIDTRVHLNYLEAGDITSAEHFLFHVSGLEVLAPPVAVDDGGLKPQLDFSLPGWDLILTPAESDYAGRGFSAVVRATPSSPMDTGDIGRLRRRLFILLSLLANREVGVGPICGCRKRGAVVWAEWVAPRLRPGPTSFRWCPPQNLDKALPLLAEGFRNLAQDPAMEEIVDRTVNHLLVTCGEELIDARIPVLTAGLDLLAWGQLRRNGWSMRKLKDLKLAESTRHLLEWAGIPTAIPESLDVFPTSPEASGPADGPQAISGVRNRLVHPPRHIDDPAWPDDSQLRAAWRLGTWYLELALLRVLDYDGEYQTRLELDRYVGHLEPVPWATRRP